MDALTSELEVELAALRRRAYGPDADIAGDPEAASRLRELEARRHPAHDLGFGFPDTGGNETPELPDTGRSTTTAIPPVGSDAGARAPGADAAPPEADDVPYPGPVVTDRSGSGHWWARRTIWIPVAAALAGVAVGLFAPLATRPQPDAVLRVAGSAPASALADDAVAQTLDYLEVKPSSLRRLDQYGDIQAWIADGADASSCLLLSSAAAGLTGGFYGVSCTPPGVDWILDVRLDDRMDRTFPGRKLPVGTLLRFQGSGDEVEIWITVARSSA